MLAIQVNLNVFLVMGMLVLAFLAGYFIRNYKVASVRQKVIELENEMLSNHAEILDLQRQNASLEQQLKQHHIPVIPMNKGRQEKGSDDADNSRKFPASPQK